MAGNSEDEFQLFRLHVLSLPPHVIRDLLSRGVCGHCIFRLFGVHARAYSSAFISTSILYSVLKDPGNPLQTAVKNGSVSHVGLHDPHSSKERGSEPVCSICFGILQFKHNPDTVKGVPSDEGNPVSEFAASITELVKKEGHEIDSFSLEVSIPPVILENEGAIRLYIKHNYGSEDWFQEKFLTENISLKDALKSTIKNLLETTLQKEENRQVIAYVGKAALFALCRAQTGFELNKPVLPGDLTDLWIKRSGAEADAFIPELEMTSLLVAGTVDDAEAFENIIYSNGDSTAVTEKIHDDLQDHALHEISASVPEKVCKPCDMTFHCYRTPIYIGGRYLKTVRGSGLGFKWARERPGKYSRNVSQTKWIIDDERMGEASVEEIIASSVLPTCRGDNYKFHAAGREDIDVRMLGSGRPFLVEVINARCPPSAVEISVIEDKINNSSNRFVGVRNLKVLGNEAWDLMREGEAEKQKQYAAIVWISRPLEDSDVQNISSLKDMAGTYIKEFVHGDLGRTDPRAAVLNALDNDQMAGRKTISAASAIYFMWFALVLWMHTRTPTCPPMPTPTPTHTHALYPCNQSTRLESPGLRIGSILGCRAEILQLDVTDVKMDCFN
ncbi:hypothetical protein ACLOJK_002295 [Asimina triloba]